MLSNYVGEERFLLGVSLYLKKRMFGNSVTKDLWEAVAAATGEFLSVCKADAIHDD
jgi:aminopeptidase 2